MRKLNFQHRAVNRSTNVLAFPLGEPMQPDGPRHLGDIVLAYETVVREAGLSDHSFISEDDIAEMTRAVRLHRLAERECEYIRRAIDGTVLEIQLPHFGVRTQNKTCFRRARRKQVLF